MHNQNICFIFAVSKQWVGGKSNQHNIRRTMTEAKALDKTVASIAQELDKVRNEYAKLLYAKDAQIKALHDKLDRANDALTQMVESRKEYYDV